MQLLLLGLAVCAVGRGNIQSSQLMNFGFYYRDWDVNTPVPDDGVAGGVDAGGHTIYVARSVYNANGAMVPGKASPKAKKMWFEAHGREQTKTKDIEILCVLNENRLKWVVVNSGVTVDSVVGDNNVLISTQSPYFFATGRQKIGNQTEVGRVGIDYGKFCGLTITQNGKCWHVHKEYQVLVYVENQSDGT